MFTGRAAWPIATHGLGSRRAPPTCAPAKRRRRWSCSSIRRCTPAARRSDPAHLLASPERLAADGIEVVDVDRGGDVTYHGPGQLVAYPILNLRRRGIYPISFVRGLEQTLVTALAALGVSAEARKSLPGVWVGNDKIAALGVHVRGGVSMHGIALNLAPDLTAFEAIVPCGLHDAGITSVERYCGAAPDQEVAKEAFIKAFAQTFDVVLRDADGEMALANGN